MNTNAEMVLFFVNDKEQDLEKLLHLQQVNQMITPAQTLQACVQSLRRHTPNARIALITDADTNIHSAEDRIEVLRDGGIAFDRLIYDRVRVYKEYLEKALEEGRTAPIFFLDTDLLINKNLLDAFALPFDVGFTATFPKNLAYSARGLVMNSNMTPVNGGVMMCRPTRAAVQFYREWLSLIETLGATDDLAEYGHAIDAVRKDFLKWWGAQHALMVMLGRQMLAGERDRIMYNDAHVRIFDGSLYNYSPPILDAPNGSKMIDISESDTVTRYVFHMKGVRKLFIPQLSARMEQAHKSTAH